MSHGRKTVDPLKPFYFSATVTEAEKPDRIELGNELVQAEQGDGALEALTEAVREEASNIGTRHYVFEARPVKRVTRRMVKLLGEDDNRLVLGFTLFTVTEREPTKRERRKSEGEWRKRDGKEWLRLKPAYYDVPERVFMAIALTDERVTLAQVLGWNSKQRRRAAEWAISTHLSASDNEDVGVPPKPRFLEKAHA